MLALYRYLSAQASCASTPPADAPYEACRAIRLQGINATPLMLIAFARGRPRGAHPDAPRRGREEGTAVSEPRRAVHSFEAPTVYASLQRVVRPRSDLQFVRQ